MHPDAPPKMERMLRTQAVGCILVVLAASLGSISLLTDSFGWSFGVLLLAMLTSFILSRIGVYVITYISQLVYYKGDWQSLLEDANMMARRFDIKATKPLLEKSPGEQFMLKIVKQPEHIMGNYMDTPFYEWIEVLGANGNPVRMNFHGTVDLKAGIPAIPDGCILLPPGILYQVDIPNK